MNDQEEKIAKKLLDNVEKAEGEQIRESVNNYECFIRAAAIRQDAEQRAT